MGFFSILFKVCSGTEVFFSLLRFSLWRPLFHLGLLLFVASSFITLCLSFAVFDDINYGVNAVNEHCGNVNFTPNGIFASVKPTEPRSFHVTSNIVLSYQGAATSVPEDFDRDDTMRGLIWNPGIIAAWYKTESGEYLVVPLIYAPLKISLAPKAFAREGVAKYIRENSFPSDLMKFPVQSVSLPSVVGTLKFYVWIALFLFYFVQYYFQTLFMTLMFAGIIYLFSRRNLGNLTFKDIVVLAIYAGFPAIIIASFFPAFNLPLEFSTVYIFSFAIYFIIIIFRFEQKHAPPRQQQNDGGDDDF